MHEGGKGLTCVWVSGRRATNASLSQHQATCCIKSVLHSYGVSVLHWKGGDPMVGDVKVEGGSLHLCAVSVNDVRGE